MWKPIIFLFMLFIYCCNGEQWKEIIQNRQDALGNWEFDAARKFLANPDSADDSWTPRFNETGKPKLLTCYYTYEPPKGPKPSEIDAHLCTHILLFGGGLSSNLSFTFPELNVLNAVNSVKKRNPELKILLTFGTTENADMSKLVVNSTLIHGFAQEVVHFLRISNFDGIDFDWEFPVWSGQPSDKQGFVDLLKEVRFQFTQVPSKKYLISAAVPAPWNIVDSCCDVPEMNKYLDFINLMTYDFHNFQWYTPIVGHNAPLFKKPYEIWLLGRINTEYSAFYWYKKGMDHWKILVGIPTYARGFTLLTKYFHFPYAPAVGVSYMGDSSTYYEMLSLLASGYTRVWDDNAMVPYCYKKDDWWSYEDVFSARSKAAWIKKQNFGGAMIFILNSDDWAGVHTRNGTKYPICTVVHDVLYQ